MKIKELHPWRVSPAEARDIQYRLAAMVSRRNEIAAPRFVAGADIAVRRQTGEGTAAVVVLDYPGLRLVETRVVRGQLTYLYVPGLLSFRECPLMLEAFETLSVAPDLVFIDGQGIAHPRRFGIACHVGVLLDVPTIGCAKSLLCGTYEAPGEGRGSFSEILDHGEITGVALRTKSGSRPVIVSTGHKIDLVSAVHWVNACCRDHRLPEPSRLAHLAAGGNQASGDCASATAAGKAHASNTELEEGWRANAGVQRQIGGT